jgi:hypothetical protein
MTQKSITLTPQKAAKNAKGAKMSTISTTITNGITLSTSGTYASPLTITATGAVEPPAGFIGIYGSVRTGWDVVNAGLIEGQPALDFEGAGTVTNFGTIVGTGDGHTGVGMSTGSVDNTGLIAGDNAVEVAFYKGGGTGTVTNSGTILGTGTHGSGISLDGGGSVGNTGLIEGRDGVQINYAQGLITNLGTIVGTEANGFGVLLGYGTLMNSGSISGVSSIAVVDGGGVLDNQVNGVIVGVGGVATTYRTVTVTNAGTIEGTRTGTYYIFPLGDGIFLGDGGAVANQAGGVLAGVSAGVYLAAEADVTNAGIISGSIGVAIAAGDARPATVVNYGAIAGTGGIAIALGSANDEIVIERGSLLQGAIGNFQPGDRIDLPGIAFDPNGSANLSAANVL